MDKLKIQVITWSIISIVIIALFLILNPFKIISATERGLKFRWGSIQEVVLSDGMHFRFPIMERIEAVNIQPIQLDSKIEVGASGAITKDNQTIGADLTIFYKYKQDQLVAMWRDYGTTNLENIIIKNIAETFKAVIGQYDIFSLPTVQDEIRNKSYEALKLKLAGYPIEITELKVINYDWSDEFDKQIQATMERAQQVKQKEQELLITQQEAQKKVKEADADKQAMITRAEGEKEQKRLQADAKALEGEGIRKYNESVATNWDIELKKMQLNIELQRIEKWNGQYVPVQNYTPIPYNLDGSLQGK
jgi:regulator of protease activity HflC (stomatin/prohibitin superfamily)